MGIFYLKKRIKNYQVNQLSFAVKRCGHVFQ